jgi:hypothetical protein
MDTQKILYRNVQHVLLQLSYKRLRDIRIVPLYATTVTRRRWLRPVKFGLEGTATRNVGIPGFSRIPIVRSHVK